MFLRQGVTILLMPDYLSEIPFATIQKIFTVEAPLTRDDVLINLAPGTYPDSFQKL
jgi:hypothetical protein